MKYVSVVYFTSGNLNTKNTVQWKMMTVEVGSHSYILCYIVFYSTLKIFLQGADVNKMHLSTTI